VTHFRPASRQDSERIHDRIGARLPGLTGLKARFFGPNLAFSFLAHCARGCVERPGVSVNGAENVTHALIGAGLGIYRPSSKTHGWLLFLVGAGGKCRRRLESC
jgi:hypothetical protein